MAVKAINATVFHGTLGAIGTVQADLAASRAAQRHATSIIILLATHWADILMLVLMIVLMIVRHMAVKAFNATVFHGTLGAIGTVQADLAASRAAQRHATSIIILLATHWADILMLVLMIVLLIMRHIHMAVKALNATVFHGALGAIGTVQADLAASRAAQRHATSIIFLLATHWADLRGKLVALGFGRKFQLESKLRLGLQLGFMSCC